MVINGVFTRVIYFDSQLNYLEGSLTQIPPNAVCFKFVQHIPYFYKGEQSFFVYGYDMYVGSEVKLEDTDISPERLNDLKRSGYDRQLIMEGGLSNILRVGDRVFSTHEEMAKAIKQIYDETLTFTPQEIEPTQESGSRK